MASTTMSVSKKSASEAAAAAAAGASLHWEAQIWQDLPPGAKFDNLGPCLSLASHLENVEKVNSSDGHSCGKGRIALVPGCGRGYDAHLLASHGYKVVGLDLAPSATKAAKDWAKTLDCSQEQKDRVECVQSWR